MLIEHNQQLLPHENDDQEEGHDRTRQVNTQRWTEGSYHFTEDQRTDHTLLVIIAQEDEGKEYQHGNNWDLDHIQKHPNYQHGH